MTSDEVEHELDKRDRRAEMFEGQAKINESTMERLKREEGWTNDASKRAQAESAAKKTRTV